MELRLNIGTLLRQRHLTTADLAARAKISRTTAMSLAGGWQQRIDLDVIARVAAALGVGPLALFEEVPRDPDGDAPP